MGGWMPMPAMMPYAYPPQPQMGMQPIMPLAAPSHNANIHDFIQIEELDDAHTRAEFVAFDGVAPSIKINMIKVFLTGKFTI